MVLECEGVRRVTAKNFVVKMQGNQKLLVSGAPVAATLARSCAILSVTWSIYNY